MSDTLYALLPVYGPPLLGLVTFLSCLALPVPSSLMMLAAGGFVVSGDMTAISVLAYALGGAILGDQTGYFIGRLGRRLFPPARHGSKRARLMADARRKLRQRGLATVFLSRWLFSPLGPYVNFASGGAALRHGTFTLAGVAGEVVWVGVYIGLGAAFAGNITYVAEMTSDALGLVAALGAAIGFGVWLRAAARRRAKREKDGQ